MKTPSRIQYPMLIGRHYCIPKHLSLFGAGCSPEHASLSSDISNPICIRLFRASYNQGVKNIDIAGFNNQPSLGAQPRFVL